MLLLEFLKYRREYPRADTQIFSENFQNDCQGVLNSKDKVHPTRRLVNELINEL